MLSYQHEYHAGNHADVVKHSVLALLIDALQRKPTPIRVIDSHAGAGAYDLPAREAQEGGQFAEGGGRVQDARLVLPEPQRYAAPFEALDGGDVLQRDSGAPQRARMLLREDEQLERYELHPQAPASLQQESGG